MKNNVISLIMHKLPALYRLHGNAKIKKLKMVEF